MSDGILRCAKLTLALELGPSAGQHTALLRTVERCNDACNWIAEVAFRERCANKIRLQKIVYLEARERFELPGQMATRPIPKVVEADKCDRTVQPHFRAHGAVPYDQRNISWKAPDRVGLLTLNGREAVPYLFGEYQNARRDRTRGQADLVLRRNVFSLYATADAPEPPQGRYTEYLGIDLGIVDLATDSDGIISTGEAGRRLCRVSAHRRRNLSREGTKACRRKLRRISGRQRRFQADTNHRNSKHVVAVARRTKRGLAREDLQGIRERGTVRRRQRARHANWGFSRLRSPIGYKVRQLGVPAVLVDPRNTSRTCPDRACIDQVNRPTRDRFECVSCGLAGPADAIAARNIAFRARAAVMQPKVSDAGSVPEAPETSHLL